MKTFDPFCTQKKESFLKSLASVVLLGEYVQQQSQMRNLSQLEMKKELLRLVKVIFFVLFDCLCGILIGLVLADNFSFKNQASQCSLIHSINSLTMSVLLNCMPMYQLHFS